MPSTSRRPARPLGLGLMALSFTLLLGSTACGPFGYLKRVAVDADRAVNDAEAAGAEELAPYEYWGSKAYLEQSKVMMGYSEYQRSFDYGDRAKQLAVEAKKKAARNHAGATVEHAEGVAAPDELPPPADDAASEGASTSALTPTQGSSTEASNRKGVSQ